MIWWYDNNDLVLPKQREGKLPKRRSIWKYLCIFSGIFLWWFLSQLLIRLLWAEAIVLSLSKLFSLSERKKERIIKIICRLVMSNFAHNFQIFFFLFICFISLRHFWSIHFSIWNLLSFHHVHWWIASWKNE